MRLKNLPSEFQEALPVLKKIKNAGFDAYFVGGSVRDALLNDLFMMWILRFLLSRRNQTYF